MFYIDLIEEVPDAVTTNPLAERLKQGAGSTFLLLVFVKINTDSPHSFVQFSIVTKNKENYDVPKAENNENLNGFGDSVK